MKCMKKAMVMLIAMCCVVTSIVPIYAEYRYTGVTVTKTSLFGLGKKTYTYKLYEDTELQCKPVGKKFGNADVTKIIYHKKGISTKISQTKTFRYFGEDTKDFNLRLGLKGGVSPVQKVLELAGGQVATKPGIFLADGKTGVELKDESTGYYTLTVVQNCKRYKLEKYKDGVLEKSTVVYIPTGDPYVTLMYSKDNKAPFTKVK